MSADNEKKKIDAAMLMDSIGGIDEDLLREADSFRNGNVVSFKPKKKKAPGYIALPIAAAAVLVVGVIVIGRSGLLSLKNATSESTAPSYSDGTMYENAADSGMTDGAAFDGSVMEDAASESSAADDYDMDYAPDYESEFTEGLEVDGLNEGKNQTDFAEENNVSQTGDIDIYALNLPEGYSFEEYEDIYSYRKGMLILPMQYEEGSSPDYRRASGSWSEIQTEAGVYVNVRFDENGVPAEDSGIMENHTTSENIKTFKCENLEGWYCIESSRKYDLYSAAELSNGVTGDETSDYTVFLFVKEDADKYYELMLSTKCFSVEEAEKIALSVKI